MAGRRDRTPPVFPRCPLSTGRNWSFAREPTSVGDSQAKGHVEATGTHRVAPEYECNGVLEAKHHSSHAMVVAVGASPNAHDAATKSACWLQFVRAIRLAPPNPSFKPLGRHEQL